MCIVRKTHENNKRLTFAEIKKENRFKNQLNSLDWRNRPKAQAQLSRLATTTVTQCALGLLIIKNIGHQNAKKIFACSSHCDI
ncbi:CLUMA_CG005067, isoform A [Clunio marinus]|uniref:CLUMA_CG005067, isoform A n=1 Tax=Clunio marinus TaxID=568069 RepID=A0A1J1HV23_9DIPT|nr:CLUMA_CG005067, isoform A [Clunio marinus]